MGLRFLHTVAVPDQAIAADGIFQADLAVNPLSVVIPILRPLNDTGTLANFARWRQVAAAMNNVNILYRGESIVNMRGEDAAAMAFFRHGCYFQGGNDDNVDNERRAVGVPIFLGKHAYDPSSCFPATRRGELQLQLDLDIADTGYDGLRLSVETIELLGAEPKEYEKTSQITQTFAATGDVDVDLPIGNMVRGLLLWGTTAFGGATPAPSWGRLKVLLDNQEYGYGSTDFEVAQTLYTLWGRQPPLGDHKHTLNAAGAGVEETTSTFDVGEDFNQLCYLDYDPSRDDTYSLETGGHNSFKIRANAETADAVRVIPVEVIKL